MFPLDSKFCSYIRRDDFHTWILPFPAWKLEYPSVETGVSAYRYCSFLVWKLWDSRNCCFLAKEIYETSPSYIPPRNRQSILVE